MTNQKPFTTVCNSFMPYKQARPCFNTKLSPEREAKTARNAKREFLSAFYDWGSCAGPLSWELTSVESEKSFANERGPMLGERSAH